MQRDLDRSLLDRESSARVEPLVRRVCEVAFVCIAAIPPPGAAQAFLAWMG
jgi:hypothetical protein